MPVQSNDAEMMGHIVFFALALAGALLLWGFGEERNRRKIHELMEKDWGARVIGLFSIVVALAFGYMGAYSDMCKVLRHEHSFLYSAGGIYLPAFMALIGIMLLLTGSKWRKVMPSTGLRENTMAQWLVIVILVAGPFIAMYFFEHWLSQRGYERAF